MIIAISVHVYTCIIRSIAVAALFKYKCQNKGTT